MLELTDMQRKFVLALLETGDDNHARAAAMAGYSANSPTSLRVTGYRLARNPKVIDAIHEESRKRLGAAAAMVVTQAIGIASNKQSKNQMKALTFIADRIGFHAVTEAHNKTEVTLNADQLTQQAVQLCRELGLDPAKVLGPGSTDKKLIDVAGAIDTTFEEVRSRTLDALTADTQAIEQDDLGDLLQ